VSAAHARATHPRRSMFRGERRRSSRQAEPAISWCRTRRRTSSAGAVTRRAAPRCTTGVRCPGSRPAALRAVRHRGVGASMVHVLAGDRPRLNAVMRPPRSSSRPRAVCFGLTLSSRNSVQKRARASGPLPPTSSCAVFTAMEPRLHSDVQRLPERLTQGFCILVHPHDCRRRLSWHGARPVSPHEVQLDGNTRPRDGCTGGTIRRAV